MSIDIFPWNDNFNCGIDIIDEQHRGLVELLNELASCIAVGRMCSLEDIFNRLASYTIYHFDTEEKIWAEYLPNDKLEIEHKSAHYEFVKRIKTIKESIVTSPDDEIFEKLLSFLTRWLASHILEHDRMMATIIIQIQSGKSLAEAKHNSQQIINGTNKFLVELILSMYDSFSATSLNLMREIKYRKEREDQVLLQSQSLEQLVMDTVGLTIALRETHDPYTVGHESRVSKYAVEIAQELNLNEEQIKGIQVGSSLHDTGKIAVPLQILIKPGKLTPLEFEHIKTHPIVGYNLLSKVNFPWPVAEMTQQHHERIDGSGYPFGLKEDQISIEAKIIAVADVVEAMSSHRPYRPSLGLEKALDEIKMNRGILYDKKVVDACLRRFK